MRKQVLSIILSIVVFPSMFMGLSVHSKGMETKMVVEMPDFEPTPTPEPIFSGDFECQRVNFDEATGEYDISIIKYHGPRDIKEIVIPAEIDGHKVVSIDASGMRNLLFRGIVSLEKVVIPESVTSIVGPVFRSCTSLKTIDGIYDDKEYILSYDTFLGTPWYEEVAKNSKEGIVTIGTTVFDMNEVSGVVTIPEGVTRLSNFAVSKLKNGDYYFDKEKDITVINLPSTLTSLTPYSISFSKLTAVNVADGNPVYHCKDGVLYKGNYIALYPEGKTEKKFTVPENIVRINDISSKYIEELAFEGSSITLGSNALSSCENLKKITLPKNVVLGESVFEGTKIKKIHLTENAIRVADKNKLSDNDGSGGMSVNSVSTKMDIAPDIYCPKSIFSGCQTLKKITVSKKNKYFFVKDGVLYYKGDDGEFFLYDYPAARKKKTLIVEDGVTEVYSLQYAKNLRTLVLPDSIETVYFDKAKEASKHIKTIKYTGIRFDWKYNVLVGGGRSQYFPEGYSIDFSKVKMVYRAKPLKTVKVKLKVSANELTNSKLRSKLVVKYKGGKLDKDSFSASVKSNKKNVILTLTGKGKYYGKIVKKYRK